MKLTRIKTILFIASIIMGSVSLPAKANENSGRITCSEGGSVLWLSLGQFWDLIGANNCKGSLEIPEGAKSINSVLSGSAITNIILPSTVTQINEGAFQNTKLTSFTIPSQLTTIGNRAFAGTPIVSIDFPDNIRSIGADVFDGSLLETVNISSGATGISSNAFRGAAHLSAINVATENPDLSSDSGVLFNKSLDTLLTYPLGKSDRDYAIVNSVTHIGNYAFAYQTHLVNLTIPSSVTDIGESAFLYASSIKNYKIPSGAIIATDAFRGTGITYRDRRIKCSKSGYALTTKDTIEPEWPEPLKGNNPSDAQIAKWEASHCRGTLKIPAEITHLKENSFYGSRLTTLVIPDTVVDIDREAFSTSRLVSVTLPYGLKKISTALFVQATLLETVKIPKTVTTIEDEAFLYTDSLENITIPSSVKSIGQGAFQGSGIKKIALPYGIKTIEDGTFAGTSHLEEIQIPSSVKVIARAAFARSGIKFISLPNGVTELGGLAFGCNGGKLTVVLPKSVKSISSTAFTTKGCLKPPLGLPKVYFLGDAPDVDGVTQQKMTIYIQKGAKGFNLDPVKKTWHGFTIAYGSPPKVSK